MAEPPGGRRTPACSTRSPNARTHDLARELGAGDPEKLAKLTKINQYHVDVFSRFLDRLRATPDGDGSLLDHSMIVYGAGMADSNAHASDNLPILLAGGAAGTGGRHVRYSPDTPLANLHLTLLDRLGLPVDSLGHATGLLPLGG